MTLYSDSLINQIRDKTVIWDQESLSTVFRVNSTDIKIFKQKEEIVDLAIALNEELIKVSVDYYKAYDDSSYRKLIDTIDNTGVPILQEMVDNTHYWDIVYMKYHAWKWLSKQSETIELKKRNICWYMPELKIMAAVGDVNPKHMNESFRKGIKQYVVFPMYRGNGKAPILTFTPNEKFEQLQKDEKRVEKELKQFFLKKSRKEENSYNYKQVNQQTLFEFGNLVEFMADGNVLRGIFLSTISNKKDMTDARKIYENELENSYLHYPEEMYRELGQKVEKNTYEWLGSTVFSEASLLIKHPIKHRTGVKFHYYTPSLQDVKTIVKHDIESIVDTIKSMIKKSEIENLAIDFERRDDESGAHATYDPQKHRINYSFLNSFDLCVKRYIHEGLTPEQTFALLTAHELGHAHPNSQYLYTEEFYNLIEELNLLNKSIIGKWKKIKLNMLEKEEVEQVKEEVIRYIKAAKEYANLELQGEKDAFAHGYSFVPKAFYYFFETESYTLFLQYKEKNEWRIKEIKHLLYLIQNKLRDYKKTEEDSFLLEMFP